jgi:protoheme IX farnesyltransferase
MKLRVVELLLVSTLPAMVLAAEGLPNFGLVAATIFAGTLAAGSANAFNMVIESDLDKLMARTSKRPIVTGLISKTNATIFATIIGLLSLVLFWVFTTPLAALLALIAIVFYVVVYTMALKQRTSQNIVWGGAAGCMPVLIGWAAVTNSLSVTPWAFFFVIFFWTPPHFWALAIKNKDDYAAAGVPMLPVTDTPHVVAKQIIIYSWVMVATTLALIPIAGMNWLYSAIALASGALFIYEAYALRSRVRKNLDDLNPMRLFHWSISYLSLIFLAIGIDPFL